MRYALALVAAAAWCQACKSGSCEPARDEMIKQIHAMCKRDVFRTSAFCSVCVAHGYYSIEDSCTCRDLNFDADFCLYADTGQADASTVDVGSPKLRAALTYAADVCRGRTAVLPNADAAVAPNDDGGVE